MAEVAEKEKQQGSAGATGKVTRVIGVVVDAEFPAGELPELLEAVVVTKKDGKKVVMEVQQEIGDNAVRCIAMDATDGFRRGDPVQATGGAITVPVGVETLGRMFNVIGEAIDDEPAPEGTERWPIHRSPPAGGGRQCRVPHPGKRNKGDDA